MSALSQAEREASVQRELDDLSKAILDLVMREFGDRTEGNVILTVTATVRFEDEP